MEKKTEIVTEFIRLCLSRQELTYRYTKDMGQRSVDPVARSASASKCIYTLDPLLALTCGVVAFGCEAEGPKSQIHAAHIWGVSQWTYCKKIISTLIIWLSIILELKTG